MVWAALEMKPLRLEILQRHIQGVFLEARLTHRLQCFLEPLDIGLDGLDLVVLSRG